MYGPDRTVGFPISLIYWSCVLLCTANLGWFNDPKNKGYMDLTVLNLQKDHTTETKETIPNNLRLWFYRGRRVDWLSTPLEPTGLI